MSDHPAVAVVGVVVTAVAGLASAAAGAILAATVENTTVAAGTTLATVIAFAGLLIKQVNTQQRAVWAIVRAKDAEIDDLRDELHITRWEREVARYNAGERPNDPGPFFERTRS